MNNIIQLSEIQNRIYSIRGVQVMIDRDLVEIYQVVKRNIKRFTDNFRFQLTTDELDYWKSQIVILKNKQGKHSKFLPYAFTKQGVLMLVGILNSDIAIEVNTFSKIYISSVKVFDKLKKEDLV